MIFQQNLRTCTIYMYMYRIIDFLDVLEAFASPSLPELWIPVWLHGVYLYLLLACGVDSLMLSTLGVSHDHVLVSLHEEWFQAEGWLLAGGVDFKSTCSWNIPYYPVSPPITNPVCLLWALTTTPGPQAWMAVLCRMYRNLCRPHDVGLHEVL